MYNTPEKRPFYNKRLLLLGLTLTICLQLMVLTTEFVSSVWPLWFGKPILLKTVPVDPRSLFRGNYVLLNYEISVLDKALSQTPLKKGQIVYVTLELTDNGYKAVNIHHNKPDNSIFIRGRVSSVSSQAIRLKYGIEAYFMPKEKALKVEATLRRGGNAQIYLLNNGKAAIAGLQCKSGDC